MRKKTITVMVLMIVSALLLSGCGVQNKFFKGKTDQIETYNFRQGTTGLLMEYVRGMPPDKMYAGTEFSLAVKVKNIGAHDIKEGGELRLSVPDTEAFTFVEGSERTFFLDGKSLYVKEGQETVLTFPAKSVCIPYGSFRKNYTTSIQAIACYPYETIAQADLCIDTLFYKRTKEEKIECKMKSATLSGGQGGPVGLDQIPQPQIIQSKDKVKVEITIPMKKLAPSSTIIFSPKINCIDFRTQQGAAKNINDIEYEVSLAGKPMTCRPAKEIKLKEKTGAGVICSAELDANAGAFITPLIVKMKYNVVQKTHKRIHIDPPPGGAESVDCQKIKQEDACSKANPGFSCRDVGSECPGGDAACIEKLGCKTGLCPGGTTNVCCP